MTRRLIPASAGFLAGLFVSFELCVNGLLGISGCVYLIASAAIIGLFSMLLDVRFRLRVFVFLAAFVIACAYSAVYTAFKLMPLEALDGETVEIVGRVIDYSDGDRSAVTLKGGVNGIRTKVLVYINGFVGDFGDEIRLSARVSKHSDSPFFRAREHYLPDGIMLTASAVGDVEITPSERTAVDILRAYSRRASLAIRQAVGGEAGEFLAAMITGDRTSYSDSLRLSLNRAGVGHLAAVSGLHVSVIALAVMTLMRKLKAPRIVGAAATEACVAAFVIFSGLRISAIRAGIMMTVAILSTLVKRRGDTLNTLCLCALMMTVWNPYSAADSSLLLSLSGVFGVGVMSPAVSMSFNIRGKTAKALIALLCACAATAPFISLYFNEMSLISPLTNLIAIPVCSAALIFGMLYALLGCRIALLARLAGVLIGAVVRVCDALSELSFTYIPLGSKMLAITVWTSLALIIAIYLATHKTRVAALCTVLCAAAVVGGYSVQNISARNDIILTVLNRGEDHALVLRKDADCIIIDYDGNLSGGIENVIERSGITNISAVILFDRAEAAYSSYSDLSILPDTIYLPEGAYVFGGEVEAKTLLDGSEMSIFGISVRIENGEVGISFCDEAVTVTENGSGNINLLNGITVIKENGEIHAYKGDIIKDIKLGVANSGSQADD